MRVEQLVSLMEARGLTPEEVHEELPHLSMAEIHAALSYYYDHKDEVDRAVVERRAYIAQMRAAAEETPGRKKLRELGLRP